MHYEDFFAVQYPFAVFQPRFRCLVGGIRTGIRLGQGERGDDLTGYDLRDVFLLLLFAGEVPDWFRRKHCYGRQKAGRRIPISQFLAKSAVLDRGPSAAAILFGQWETNVALFGKLAIVVKRELDRLWQAVQFLRNRHDFLFRKVTNGVTDWLLAVIDIETVHRGVPSLRSRPSSKLRGRHCTRQRWQNQAAGVGIYER